MALFDVIGELYEPNADVKPRFLVNQGGTSSGKTYTIMQRLIVLSFEHPMAIITVCDLPFSFYALLQTICRNAMHTLF